MSGEWGPGRPGGIFNRAGESSLLYDETDWSAGKPGGQIFLKLKLKVSIEIEDVQLCQFKPNNKQEKFREL